MKTKSRSKPLKTSKAILKGFASVNGNQCYNQNYVIKNGVKVAACVNGAYMLGGRPRRRLPSDKFREEYGISPIYLNDGYKVPVDVIAGMYAAIGD